MMQFAGALFVLIAGTLIGYLQSARYAARPRQIRQLMHALQRLETEIAYSQTPLPEALGRIAKIVPPPLAQLFAAIAASLADNADHRTVRQSWEQVITEGWERTAMRRPEREALVRLGATLGVSERDDQIKHMRLAMHQLQAEEASAREEQQRYEKMSRSLGVLGAVLVVILML